MRFEAALELLLVHCQGEIGKIIISGAPGIPGASVLEKMNHINEVDDSLRRFVTTEPRAHAVGEVGSVGAMLSAGVVPGLHRANEPDWNGHVFRATLPVIAGVMAVVLLAAWALTHYFPGAQTLGEAFRSL